MSTADRIEQDRRLAELARLLVYLFRTARARGAHQAGELDTLGLGPHPSSVRLIWRGRRYLLTLRELRGAELGDQDQAAKCGHARCQGIRHLGRLRECARQYSHYWSTDQGCHD